jgi:hypothetical protein
MVKLVGDDMFKIKRIEYYDRSEGWNKVYEECYNENLNIYVPNMTSDILPSPFIASAYSEFDANYAAWKAFDGNEHTRWSAFDDGTGGTTNYWLQIKLDQPINIGAYSMSSGGYEPGYYYYAKDVFKSWQLQGSNNGTDWDVLDMQTGHTWGLYETKTFALSVAPSYQYFKLQKINNEFGYTVTEFKLFPLNWLDCPAEYYNSSWK